MKNQLFNLFASVHARILVLSMFVCFTLTGSAQMDVGNILSNFNQKEPQKEPQKELEQPVNTLTPKQDEKKGKWGLVDSTTNQWVVKPKYDKIGPSIMSFSGVMYIPVETINKAGNALKGMLTREGKEIVKCKYKEILPSTTTVGDYYRKNPDPERDFFLLITYKNTLDIYSPQEDFTVETQKEVAKTNEDGYQTLQTTFSYDLIASTGVPNYEKINRTIGKTGFNPPYRTSLSYYFDDNGNAINKEEAENIAASRKFIRDWAEFMRVAAVVAETSETSEDIVPVYQKLDEHQFSKHKEIVKLGLDMLCDSIYYFIRKPNRTQIKCLTLLQDLYLSLIIWDYYESHIPTDNDLNAWALYALIEDVANSAHREEYQRILEIIERGLQGNLESITGHVPYYMTMQLAALCGLGRWKEAASYYPKVHRAVTENGRYAVPYVLNQIEAIIRKQGFNVITPNYKTDNGKVASENSGNGAAEFFLLLGESYWEKYKEKKRKEKIEKEWLERLEKLEKQRKK